MTYEKLEEQIRGLLAEALPLRELDDDDPRVEPLAGIVDQINRLRAKQSAMKQQEELDAPPGLPARAELERRAKAAGIVFSPKISDAKLAERIEEGAQ